MELQPKNDGPHYEKILPQAGEYAESYARRLEIDGYEERFIRKALRAHFGMKIEEFAKFFENYELARLRHLHLLRTMAPDRTGYSFQRKVAKNLGVSEKRAVYWIERFLAAEAKKLCLAMCPMFRPCETPASRQSHHRWPR